MSYSKKPVLIHYGNWSDETRAHPAMKYVLPSRLHNTMLQANTRLAANLAL